MGVASIEKLDNASTAFKAVYDEFFAGGPPTAYEQFTEVMPNDQISIELDVIAAFPRVREWIGPKQFKDLRAYTQSIDITSYEISHEIKRKDLEYKSNGQIARGIRTFFEQQRFFYDDLLFAALIANTWTGYDGVALLSDSHPNTNSTGDNLTTSALTQATLDAGVQAMEGFQSEDGKPLGTFPTHLVVGPQQRKIAHDLTGSDRLIPFSNAGVPDAVSGDVAVGSLPNYLGGAINVVVTPWVSGTKWFLIDASKSAKPMVFVENMAPTPCEQTEKTGEARFMEDVYRYSVESDGATAAGLWQTIYGDVS